MLADLEENAECKAKRIFNSKSGLSHNNSKEGRLSLLIHEPRHSNK
jgi:hypothetical protein